MKNDTFSSQHNFLGWLVNIKTITELYEYVVKTGEMNFMMTFKLSQDPVENFFSSIRMSCGNNNNPTSIQFKAAFQSLLCGTLNRNDNGNSIFDDSLPITELSEVNCDFEWNIEKVICANDSFVDNVIIYISGFIIHTLIKKEKCDLCYTYLNQCENRVTCHLINVKQLGGLINPISDVVSIVKHANRNVILYFCLLLRGSGIRLLGNFVSQIKPTWHTKILGK